MCSGLSCKGGWERDIFSFFHGRQGLCQSWRYLRGGVARKMTHIYCKKPPGAPGLQPTVLAVSALCSNQGPHQPLGSLHGRAGGGTALCNGPVAWRHRQRQALSEPSIFE